MEEALGGCRMKRKQVKKMQTNRNDSGIAYQNKDIVSKVMAEVKRGTTDPYLDVGCARFELTEAFLSDLNSEEIYYEIKGKLDNGVSLSDEDLMRLIIYPLTYESDDAKRKAIDEVIELANRITDRKSAFFVYKCILVFTDKVISDETAQKIRSQLYFSERSGEKLMDIRQIESK